MNARTFDFWEQVKSRLKTKGITRENVAQVCGFSLNTFNSWINKSIIPSTEDIFRLECFLDLSMELAPGLQKSAICRKQSVNDWRL